MTAEKGTEEDVSAAYGLRLRGLRATDSPNGAPAGWEEWEVRRVVAPGCELDSREMTVWDDRALIPIPGVGRITVDRSAHQIVFVTVRALTDDAILHPGLVPAAAVVNWWKGRACVHASAVLAGGGAWALLADRGGGKSTTAALLAERGHALFTDDMLIVEGTRCFAGPESVDLREDVSERIGGTYLGRIGHRDRWRRSFPGGAAEAPLAGVVELAWADDGPHLVPLDLGARMELAVRHASMPIAGGQLLALAGPPGFRLSRPRSLDAAPAAVALLADAFANNPPQTGKAT